MFIKEVFACKTANVEEYRRLVQGRQRLLRALCALGVLAELAAFFAVPRLVAAGAHGEFCKGLYTGVGLALIVCGIVGERRLAALLRDEEKLKQARCRDNDERLQEITRRAQISAGLATLAVLYGVMLAGGLVSFELLVFSAAVVLVFFVSFIAFHCYYERRL